VDGILGMYPISSFIHCIDRLGIPLPELSLKNFLGSYTAGFTRFTDTDNIMFNGMDLVMISAQPLNQKMTNDDIEKMLKDLVKHHSPQSNIAQKYRFAAIQLIKRRDPLLRKSPERLPTEGVRGSETGATANYSSSNLMMGMNSLGGSPPQTPLQMVIMAGKDHRWQELVDAINTSVTAQNIGVAIILKIPSIQLSDIMIIINSLQLHMDVPIRLFSNEREATIEMFVDIWTYIHDSSSIEKKFITEEGEILNGPERSWLAIFAPYLFDTGVIDGTNRQSPVSTLRVARDYYKAALLSKKNPDFKGQSIRNRIHNSKIASIIGLDTFTDVNDDVHSETSTPSGSSPVMIENVKGVFNWLLPTHNTSLDVGLSMLMGRYSYIRGVEQTGRHVYVYGRGAQFRWGIDSQYGDMIFIMKPNFWKNYKHGVEMDNYGDVQRVLGVTFKDFWGEKDHSEQSAKKQMEKEALNFGFRVPDWDGMCGSSSSRENFTWCNIQIHIGDNVSFDDIDSVLVPRYLLQDSSITFDGIPVANILNDAQYKNKITVKVPTEDGTGTETKQIDNPFKNKIIRYGPLVVSAPPARRSVPFSHPSLDRIGYHPHYMSVLNTTLKPRHKVYDSVFRTLKVGSMIGDPMDREAIRTGLHRSRANGSSSAIALSWEAFTDAEEEYMDRLVHYKYY